MRMATPLISVRLSADRHPLLRRIVALIKSDPPFTAALLDLVEDTTDRDLSAIEGLDLDGRIRQLKAKFTRLERLSRSKVSAGSPGAPRSDGDRTAARSKRDARVKTRARKPALSTPRALAMRLLKVRLPTPDGNSRELTQAEIEDGIRKEMGGPRGPAQSAAAWVVRTYDRDNPARRTHRPRVARAVDEDLVTKMRKLKSRGLTQKEIAKRVGANVKTVRKYLR
jgi:hypothetical protein